jgi:hypothetical protein
VPRACGEEVKLSFAVTPTLRVQAGNLVRGTQSTLPPRVVLCRRTASGWTIEMIFLRVALLVDEAKPLHLRASYTSTGVHKSIKGCLESNPLRNSASHWPPATSCFPARAGGKGMSRMCPVPGNCHSCEMSARRANDLLAQSSTASAPAEWDLADAVSGLAMDH